MASFLFPAFLVYLHLASPASAQLSITTESLPSGMEMVPYSAGLDATNGVAPYMWNVAPPLEAWGLNGNGQAAVPPDLSDVVALAGGQGHSLALRRNGTVVAWGANQYGQSSVPPGLSNVVAIAGGGNHGLALKSNQTVEAWGADYEGQSTVPPGLSNVVAVSAGRQHSLALKFDGTVVAWGGSGYGQISVPAGLSGVAVIAAVADNSYAVKSNGTVVAWGVNWSGQTEVGGLSNVVAVTGGGEGGGVCHILFLKKDGTLTALGRNEFGEGSVPDGLCNVKAVAGGSYHNLALTTDGRVVVWGYNGYGQTNAPAGLSNVTSIAAGWYHNLALFVKPATLDLPEGLSCSIDGVVSGTPTTAGTSAVTVVVRDSIGAVTNKLLVFEVASNPNTRPVIDSASPSIGAFSMDEGTNCLFQITALDPEGNNLVYAWTRDGVGVANGSNAYCKATTFADIGNHILRCHVSDGFWTNEVYAQWEVTVQDRPLEITTLALPVGRTGRRYAVRLEASFGVGPCEWSILPVLPSLVAWGDSNYGQTTIPSGLEDVTAIARGNSHNLALTSNRTIVAWGLNSSGQTTVPDGLFGTLAAGGAHNLVLAYGHVAGWGNNQYGQATPPPGLTATRIAAGYSHSLAVKSGGTVAAWGRNQLGQTNVPSGLSGVVEVAAGVFHSLAMKSNHRVVAWGDNSGGQTNVPSNLSGVVAIAAGGVHSLALKADHTVAAWGSNSYGQTNVPPNLTDVIMIAAGIHHSLALKSDGTVVAWGLNSQGQAAVPAGLTNVLAIAAGGNGSLALRKKSTNTDLPPGLVCSENGLISGVPVQAATGLITVIVRDAAGATASKSFDLPVWRSVNPLGSVIFIRGDVIP
jgi:alpha-tubulin suppressor-like RCC1 family protein